MEIKTQVLSNQKSFKKAWLQHKWWKHDPKILVKPEEREVRKLIESKSRKKKWAEKGKMHVV
jgi:hypothetical protein